MNSKEKMIKVFDNKISACKKCWIVGYKNHSVEVMAINSSIIENLMEIKRDLGLISQSQYLFESIAFLDFKASVHDAPFDEVQIVI